jgi:hypothetical protein
MKTATYTKPLTIAFPAETFRRIKEITDQGHTSMGEWVRNAVEKALAEENNPISEGGKNNE